MTEPGTRTDATAGEMNDLLWEAVAAAAPMMRAWDTAHWVMDPEWYKAVRRAFLQPDADGEARDESKWVPEPGDMVLGYRITVTGDGGAPHLTDRPDKGDW